MSFHHIHYLNHALNREISALYFSSLIHGFAGGMLLLFTPLYFFKLGWSVQDILLWYALCYIIYFLLSPLGAQITVKFGYVKTIAISTPFALIFYASIFFLTQYPILFWISSILFGVQKALYWIAYHSDFARFIDKKSAGEEVGFLRVLLSIVGIFSPAIGGFIVVYFGFPMLFVLSGILITLSVIPLMLAKEKWESGRILQKDIFKMFFLKKLRRDFIGILATGQDLAAQVIWPIWLFIIIPSYTDIGILTTITIFFTFILMLWIGKLSNNKHKSGLIKKGAGLLSLSWLAKMFAFTPMSIFFADSLYKISEEIFFIPYVSLIYTRAAKRKIIEYNAFWQGALGLGKASVAIIFWFLLFFTDNLAYTFLVSAIFAPLFILFRDNK